MHRYLLLACGVFGFVGVALGAFGAHGLKARLSALADGPQRLAWWETATQYQLAHAVALGIVGALALQCPSRVWTWSGASFAAGIVLFSGSLYVMTLTNVRALGAITPVGGLGFLAGWTLFAFAAWSCKAAT
jgi:uncharacterized membrane protein YgdD (TMEM256/DUF423 family)